MGSIAGLESYYPMQDINYQLKKSVEFNYPRNHNNSSKLVIPEVSTP